VAASRGWGLCSSSFDIDEQPLKAMVGAHEDAREE